MVVPTDQTQTQTATLKLDAAVTPTRSLLFYTLTATIPIAVITAVLLFTNLSHPNLRILATIAAITSLVGLGRLLYEMTLDIAGYPDYKLPIWSVFYLIVYLISGFAFLFFAMHEGDPGRYFGGLSTTNPKLAFLDTTYISLSNYIDASPDPAITFKTRLPRFLAVIQGVISLFINVVIITKFVNTF
jgi:hypothetical protein